MMKKFFHHNAEKDFINVKSGEFHYAGPREQYDFDGGIDFPPLPPGITERLYEPGVRHALIRGTDVVDGGPMPWPEGDAVLAMAASLVGAKRIREENERAEAQRKGEEKAARIAAETGKQ
jgi:hypothetical protein